MASQLRRLIPPFLRQLDLWLQENHPRLWATRIHLHLWFIALLDALAFVLGLLIPVSAHRHPEPEEVWGYMMVPTVVYACFWVYRVLLFTVERRFGQRHFYAEVGELLLHWLSLLLILTLPMTLSLTLAWRIGHLVTDERLNHDVDALHAVVPWLYGSETYAETTEAERMADEAARAVEYAAMGWEPMEEAKRRLAHRQPQGHGTHRFYRDLQEYRDRDIPKPYEVETERELHEVYDDHIDAYNYHGDPADTADYDPDTAAYHLRIIDSIETHSPLLRTDLSPFQVYDHWPGKDFTPDSVLELRYLERFVRNELPDTTAINEALAIAHGYQPAVRLLPASVVLDEYRKREASTTNIWRVERPIDDIGEAKAWDYDFLEWEAILFGMVLTTFCIALLLSIFKNLYWQPFLIAVVTGAVLPILVLIFSLLTEDLLGMDEELIMLWAAYLIVAALLLLTVRIPWLKAYRTRPAVMAVLANAAAPFFAVFTLFILHDRFDIFGYQALEWQVSMLREQGFTGPRMDELEIAVAELNAWIMHCFLYTVWGGVVLYTFVLHPLFRWCWTRLMALPERR